MRRATLLRLIGIVLIVGFGAYAAFWWYAAGRIKLAAGDWARTAHERQIDVSWQTIRVAGFPFSFRLELADAVLTDRAAALQAQLRAPAVSASVWPWSIHTVQLDAPQGITALVGAESTPMTTLSAAQADGTVVADADGGATIWFALYQPKIDAEIALSARTANGWVLLPPPHPSAMHEGPGLAIAGLLNGLQVPIAPPEFSKTIDQIGFGAALTGELRPGPAKQAAAAWRDSGGTLELNHLDLRWGALGITATGTLALDGDLQPVGGFSGAISGYDQLMSALVAAGRIKASDARVARLALAMLGKVGPDGRPEISSSLTIQNGEMFLGPAKLGKAPHIDW